MYQKIHNIIIIPHKNTLKYTQLTYVEEESVLTCDLYALKLVYCIVSLK